MYDQTIGRLLRVTRRKASEIVRRENLFPMLDLCCGTGSQLLSLSEPMGLMIGLDLDLPLLEYASGKCPRGVFVGGDAASIPLKDSTLGSVVISYALHDKSAKLRGLMMKEIRRVLTASGRMILIDFDPPWNARSRLGRGWTFLIERMAGGEHFRNGQEFIRAGGLTQFASRNGLQILESRDMADGSSRFLVARFPD